jgi:hypothetical protein
MAPISSEPHTIVQSWVSVELAQELKAHARAEGCSLSSLVRDALEGTFAGSGEGQRQGEAPSFPSPAAGPTKGD